MKILAYIILTLLLAYFYRCGGISREQPSPFPIPKFLRHSWVRDFGCSICLAIMCGIWFGFNWWLLLVAGLSNLALRTYWDEV